jgi:protein-tyrosine phosphatase
MTAIRPVALFVCTANICRSPVAAALARRRWGMGVDVRSAGLSEGGRRVPSAGLQLDSELGLGLDGHVSRQITVEDLDDADLVLTMTRAHARDLMIMNPQLWPRVFTLKQFARWSANRQRGGEGDLRTWLAEAAGARDRWEIVGESPADDTADPIRDPVRAWRSMAADMSTSLDAMSRVVTGSGTVR